MPPEQAARDLFVFFDERLPPDLEKYYDIASDTEKYAEFVWNNSQMKKRLRKLSRKPGEKILEGGTECQRDCLNVIIAAKVRLTQNAIMTQLEAAGKIHGSSTIKSAIAYMCNPQIGMLVNRSDTRPRGYGLPEWP